MRKRKRQLSLSKQVGSNKVQPPREVNAETLKRVRNLALKKVWRMYLLSKTDKSRFSPEVIPNVGEVDPTKPAPWEDIPGETPVWQPLPACYIRGWFRVIEDDG